MLGPKCSITVASISNIGNKFFSTSGISTIYSNMTSLALIVKIVDDGLNFYFRFLFYFLFSFSFLFFFYF